MAYIVILRSIHCSQASSLILGISFNNHGQLIHSLDLNLGNPKSSNIRIRIKSLHHDLDVLSKYHFRENDILGKPDTRVGLLHYIFTMI